MNIEVFKSLMGKEWVEMFAPFIKSKEMDSIYSFLKKESNNRKIICPKSKNTYRTFKTTDPKSLKIVWVFQDPYSKVIGNNMVADGVALSCRNTGYSQPSLRAFFDYIRNNIEQGDKDFEEDYNLDYLCDQGVLMLNSALTVEKDKPGSHTHIWNPFIEYFIKEILNKKYNGLITVFSGSNAKLFSPFVDQNLHYVFHTEHPASAVRNNREWRGNDIFNVINSILTKNNRTEWINWTGGLPF